VTPAFEPVRQHRIHVVSLGCPKNLCDTESMMGRLAEAGHTFVADPDDATAVLVNTCSFIASATAESLAVIAEFVQRKRNGGLHALVVTGCLPQRDAPALSGRYPEVDAWLGTGDFWHVATALDAASRGQRFCRVGSPRPMPESGVPRIRTTPAHYAYLRVADGCSNCCSYCVIPQLRGPYRSRAVDAVTNEAVQLVAAGARELVLVAQDITRFGEDRRADGDLADLLGRLSQIDELQWIRIMYAYPSRISDRLIETVGTLPKVVHYLDLPIQHAATGVLRAMGRPYSRSDLWQLIRRVRRRIPDIALRTTVMVGFPGETDAQFESLLGFIDETRFDRLGTFCYSAEEGTPAAEMPSRVPEQVARERMAAVMEQQQGVSLEHNRTVVGQRFEVIVDEPADSVYTFAVGRTYRDAPEIDGVVYVEGYDGPRGRFIDVEITRAEVYDLYGHMVI